MAAHKSTLLLCPMVYNHHVLWLLPVYSICSLVSLEIIFPLCMSDVRVGLCFQCKFEIAIWNILHPFNYWQMLNTLFIVIYDTNWMDKNSLNKFTLGEISPHYSLFLTTTLSDLRLQLLITINSDKSSWKKQNVTCLQIANLCAWISNWGHIFTHSYFLWCQHDIQRDAMQ